MNYIENLWLFFIMVTGIIIVPGMDMMFVLANTLAGGRRAGAAATLGVMAGAAVHTVIAQTMPNALIVTIRNERRRFTGTIWFCLRSGRARRPAAGALSLQGGKIKQRFKRIPPSARQRRGFLPPSRPCGRGSSGSR